MVDTSDDTLGFALLEGEVAGMNGVLDTLVKEVLIKGLIAGVVVAAVVAFCRENLSVLRTTHLISSARKKLGTGDPKRIKRGVQMLLEVAVARPFRRQEMVDIVIEDCFRHYFCKSDTAPVLTPAPMVAVFVDTLKSVLGLPRADENGHSLNVDLHQVRLARDKEQEKAIYLEKMNFAGVELWGCDFTNVDFSRSTFENANLGGTHFKDCGMEFLKLDNAKMIYSPSDDRPTIIEKCHLAGSNLDKASVQPGSPEKLQLHIIRSTDIEQNVAAWLQQRGASLER